jgi:hypothetical protein
MFLALDRLRWSPLRQERNGQSILEFHPPGGAPLEREGIGACSRATEIWLLPEPVLL